MEGILQQMTLEEAMDLVRNELAKEKKEGFISFLGEMLDVA